MVYRVSIFTIILLSLALHVASNISPTPTNQMTFDTISDLEDLKNILLSVKEEFDVYDTMLVQMANEEYTGLDEAEWVEDFCNHFTILMEGFYSRHPHVSGYFINLNKPLPLLQTYTNKKTLKRSHISVLMDTAQIDGSRGLNQQLMGEKAPTFITVSNALSKKMELSYIAPLYIKGEYRGFFGVTLDLDSLRELFGERAGDGRQMTLLTKKLEILATTDDFPIGARLESVRKAAFAPLANEIYQTTEESGYIRLRYDGKAWMNVFVRLPSGQIFWEAYSLSGSYGRTNFLISVLSVFAILCMWMVQKRNGVSPFDKLADRVFGHVDFSDEMKISHKASFGTHMGFVGASIALLLFTLFSDVTIAQKIVTAVVTVVVVLSISRYRKPIFSATQNYLYLMLYLAASVVLHHLAGGFAAQNGSLFLTWCVVTVTISSFLLNNRENRGMFALFVTVLFLDAVLEIFLIPGTDPKIVIRFMTVIFFLGFALFVSTDLYVVGVFDILKKLNDSYKTLQDTQSQLVKEEKMVTLGRLIAGIAHEINTPLGAIKASAEGMEASLQSAFSALMDSQNTLNEQDKAFFFRLIDLSNESMADMYTTMQIRRVKPQMRAFFEELGYEEPELAIEKLVRLEICDLELIKENQDIFESPNIMKLLSLLISTISIIKGSYITLQSAEKAYKIIFALKSYSYTNVSSDPVCFDLPQNIDSVLVLLYNQLKRSIEIIRDCDEDIPELWGKPDELGQVWINLIQNAIYAMNESGVLKILIKREGDWVHVTVSDSGSGIAPDVLPHVFEPFYTTKSVGEGTGLGLDICKKIIEGHKGRIEVESELGIGTTFHVWLPVQ